jgi:cytochrome c553
MFIILIKQVAEGEIAMKLREIVDLPKEKGLKLGEQYLGYEQGYNQALKEIGDIEVIVDVEKIEIILAETRAKEGKRNNPDKEPHKYSHYCSCGSCHSIDMYAQAIADNLPKLVKGERK